MAKVTSAGAALAVRERSLCVVAAVLFSAALVIALLTVRDLPMMDLPQHAAQIATWAQWSELASGDRAALELNLRTPYLLAYPLARVLSPVFGVLVSLKLIVALAALGNLFAFWLLARRAGHSPWLALLGLPLTFGFSFYYGFVSFLLATPLIVLAVTAALEHARNPRWSSGLALGVLLCVTLVAHGFAAMIAMLSVVPLLILGPIGSLLRRTAPLAAPILLGLLWLTPTLRSQALYDYSIPPGRAYQWLSMIAGPGSFQDRAALALGVVVAIVLVLFLGRPSKELGRLGLLAVALTGYALLPQLFWGTAFLHERLVAFVVPALMLAFEPRRSSAKLERLGAALTFVTCASWFALFSTRLVRFNREMADYHALADELPAGLRVRPLIFQRDSRAFPGAPAYLHVSAYYHAAKGGIPAYSFATFSSSVIRYRDGHSSPLAPGMEWVPERFDASAEAELYDYFLVRGGPAHLELFAKSPLPIALDACQGSFCGYARGALTARPPWRGEASP
jgi:hypothetical protein